MTGRADAAAIVSASTTPGSPARRTQELVAWQYRCRRSCRRSWRSAAAISVQRFDDPVVLEAVGEIEDLTTGLCQKIWQKVNLLQRFDGVRHASASEE